MFNFLYFQTFFFSFFFCYKKEKMDEQSSKLTNQTIKWYQTRWGIILILILVLCILSGMGYLVYLKFFQKEGLQDSNDVSNADEQQYSYEPVEDDIPVTSQNSDSYETEEPTEDTNEVENNIPVTSPNEEEDIPVTSPNSDIYETEEVDPIIQLINSGQKYIVNCTVWGGDVTCRNGVVTNNATDCNPDCSDPSKVDIEESRKLQSSENIINSGQEYKIECKWTKTQGSKWSKSTIPVKKEVTCKNGAPVGTPPNNACIAQCSESSKVV